MIDNWQAYLDYFGGGIPGSEYIWFIFIVCGAGLALYKFRRMISDI